MKNQFTAGAIWLTLAMLSTLNPQLSTFAQGSLTPSGAPAPTMKSLDQVEPRTPIGANTTPGDADSLFKITQPGSYYLTTNHTGLASRHGIEIVASGVTLDLMGFELAGVVGSLTGIAVSAAVTNLAVRNGTVRGWGNSGVAANGAVNGQYQDLRLSHNGNYGLLCGADSSVLNCTTRSNVADGILTGVSCQVSDCTSSTNGGHGIATSNSGMVNGCTTKGNGKDGIHVGSFGTISGCTARENATNGFSASIGSTVIGCTAHKNGGDGINADNHCTIKDCTARDNADDGIETGTGCTVSACTAGENAGFGVNVFNGCTVNGSTASYNDQGGFKAVNGSTVSGCTASFNNGDAIQVTSYCRVVDNTAYDNDNGGSGAGIHALLYYNRIEDNRVTANGRGIVVDGSSNMIIRNSSAAHPLNYVIVTGNKVGVIVSVPSSTAISGSTGGAGVGTTDPWANFSF